MIKTLVVQSGKARRNQLNSWCKRQFLGRFEAICAETTEEAVQLIKIERPQIVIVDIAPELGVGFQLFEETNTLDYEKIVICENSEFAIKALRYHVADYLLRPLQGNELISAVEKLLFEKKEYKIQQLYDAKFKQAGLISLSLAVLPTDAGRILLELSKILRVKDDGEKRIIHLANGTRMDCPLSTEKLDARFKGTGLVRIDRDTIIGARHIVKFWSESDTPWIRLPDGFEAPLGFRAEHLIRKYYSQQLPAAPRLGYVSNC